MNELIKKIIQIIERDLSEVPNLEQIALELGSSRYYLSRLIKKELGESFTEYVKRRKLSQAAKEIQFSNRRILDIAIDYGYGSEEAFNRSFKDLHNQTPRKSEFHHAQLFKRSALEINPKGEMDVEIKKLKAKKLRAIGKKFSYDSFDEIYKFWMSFNQQYPFIVGETYGISLPIDSGELEEFYYLIAFDISYDVEHSFFIEIPEKSYAFFKHIGLASEMMSSFNYIWGNWRYKNKQYKIYGMDFEYYPSDYDPLDEKGYCYICLPID